MGSKGKPNLIYRLTQFLGEVGRRRVWRTALAYAAVVFVVLQLGEIVFPAFGAPNWALRLLVMACFLGFPLVLALAWAFDLTPDGIQRAPGPDGEGDPSNYTGTTLPRLALLTVIIATVGGVGWWTVQDTVGVDSAAPAGDPGGLAVPASLDEAAPLVRSLAVLPLDDYSEVEGGEYFTAGLHEELISQLSQIGSARVISRTTVVQYDATGKAMPLIAQELGVEGVIEGSVFRDGDRVRITVQLIHGPTDRHLWANSYDGTLEDAIGLQRTVAEEIAKEIQAQLFPGEQLDIPQARIASSPQVQEEYLKGRFDQSKATPEALATAVDHFEAAVEEDSSFAPAYAGLAGARFLLRYQSEDTAQGDPMLDLDIVEPLERAFKLEKDSPEAQAVFLALREVSDRLPGDPLPPGIQIMADSASLLGAEIALTATEFGRQLHGIVVKHEQRVGGRPGLSPNQRLESARRLQSTSDFVTAEEMVRQAIAEAPQSQEAWDALEHLKAVQRDFQGVASVRHERLTRAAPAPEEEASLRELEANISERGEEGYWAWRLGDLQRRKVEGATISPVLLARAYVGLHRNEDALRELENAVAAKDRNLISLWTESGWDALRTDPRFREILSKARRGSQEENQGLRDGF